MSNVIRDSIIERVIFIEGGYANDSYDSGGKTQYGITEAVARSNGYRGHMRDLPMDKAKAIYIKKYWNKLNLGDIVKIAPRVAEELFDTAVNMGTGRAGRFLQRSLNVFGKDAKLTVDGAVGPKTIKALKKFIDKRGGYGDIVLTRALDSLQGSFYITLAERRIKDKRFIYGWFKNRVG